MTIFAESQRVVLFAIASSLLAIGCVDLEYDQLSREGLLQRSGPAGWTDDRGQGNPQTCQIHNHTIGYRFTLRSSVTGTDACDLSDHDASAVALCVQAAIDAGKAACAPQLVTDAESLCAGECELLVAQMQAAYPGQSVTLLACQMAFDDSQFDPSEIAFTFEWVPGENGAHVLDTTCYNAAARVPGATARDAGPTGGEPEGTSGGADAGARDAGDLPGEDELPPDPNPLNAFVCAGIGRTLICPIRDAGPADAGPVDGGGTNDGAAPTSPPFNHLADGGQP